MLLYSLFREYLLLEQKGIYQRIDKEYTYKTAKRKFPFEVQITSKCFCISISSVRFKFKYDRILGFLGI